MGTWYIEHATAPRGTVDLPPSLSLKMKTIISTIILSLISTLSFADGHTSGKFNASGMGAWEVNAMNAGKGDMAITYDGIAGLSDDTPVI